MGIKPALGWLALLLFTTTAHAEGRDLLKEKTRAFRAEPVTMVTPKTKAPPPTPKDEPKPADRRAQ